MVTLYELVNQENLERRISEGYISVRLHPDLPLRIYNYTTQALYHHAWDNETAQCRGLIVDHHDVVVARPFEKFFDFGSARLPFFATTKRPFITTKLDGSLGVLWSYDGHTGVATRGSFTSKQALWAGHHLNTHYPTVVAPEGTTALFEVVYDANRIVVKHDREDLILLAVIDNATGADVPPWDQPAGWWPGPVVEMHYDIVDIDAAYAFGTGDAFAHGEGVVACWYAYHAPSFRLKIKHPDYVYKFRIMFNTTARTIFRALVVMSMRDQGFDTKRIAWTAGISLDAAQYLLDKGNVDLLAELLDNTPDEFGAWVSATAADLAAAYAAIEDQAQELFAELAPYHHDRRAFADALKARKFSHFDVVFDLLSGRPYHDHIWHTLEPAHATAFMAATEDL